MKTFAVDPTSIALIVRNGDTEAREEFKTKRQADKRILALIGEGYTFDNQAPRDEPARYIDEEAGWTPDAEDRYNRGGW